MTDLNELFEQILHSEKKFRARVNELRLLGLEVEQCQALVQDVIEAVHTKQGELAVKQNKLADLEVETKLLRIRKQILKDQKATLHQDKQLIDQDLVEVLKKYELNRAEIIEELSTFSQYYDLNGSGCKHRDEDLERKKNILQHEILLLETELVEMKRQQEEANKLKAALTDAEADLEKANNELAELRKVKEELEKGAISLEHEKNTTDQTLSQDPEFVRLQRELEFCKESTDELTCKQLSKEIDELQRQCYHKQMRQQLSNKKNGPQRLANSSVKSGHYNPYTHRYVPAPKTNPSHNQPSTDSNFELYDNEEFSDSHDSMNLDYDVGDGLEEWDMEIDEGDLKGDSDSSEEFTDHPPHGVNSGPRGRNAPSSNKTCKDGKSSNTSNRTFPPSNFSVSRNTSKSSISTSSRTDFMQASSVLHQSSTNKTRANASSTQKQTYCAANHKRTQKKQAGSVSARLLASPESQLTQKKKQGESIFKIPAPQESSLPRRAKKVRFHY